MSVTGAPPYFLPDAGTVRFLGWQMGGTEGVPLPEHLDAWDPDTTVTVRQHVDVDYELVSLSAGLDERADYYLTATWSSSNSGMRGRLAQVIVARPGIFVLEGELPGQEISGTLDLETTLSLRSAAGVCRAGVVAVPGSVLARSRHRLSLQASGAMFPISVVDFGATKNDALASWRLETSTDLTAPFFGSFLLYINSRDQELVRALESTKPTDATDDAPTSTRRGCCRRAL